MEIKDEKEYIAEQPIQEYYPVFFELKRQTQSSIPSYIKAFFNRYGNEKYMLFLNKVLKERLVRLQKERYDFILSASFANFQEIEEDQFIIFLDGESLFYALANEKKCYSLDALDEEHKLILKKSIISLNQELDSQSNIRIQNEILTSAILQVTSKAGHTPPLEEESLLAKFNNDQHFKLPDNSFCGNVRAIIQKFETNHMMHTRPNDNVSRFLGKDIIWENRQYELFCLKYLCVETSTLLDERDLKAFIDEFIQKTQPLSLSVFSSDFLIEQLTDLVKKVAADEVKLRQVLLGGNLKSDAHTILVDQENEQLKIKLKALVAEMDKLQATSHRTRLNNNRKIREVEVENQRQKQDIQDLTETKIAIEEKFSELGELISNYGIPKSKSTKSNCLIM